MRLADVATGRRVLTVTLNAAIDKRYLIDSLEPGTVMRVRESLASAGGKGLNVARAAAIAGATVTATGLVAGHTGRAIVDGVRAEGIAAEFVEVPGESRTCINVFDSERSVTTELLEPGPEVGAADLARFVERLADLAAHADVVTISGSAPRGAPADVYATLVAACHAAGVPVLLDSSGPTLLAGLTARPTLVKPNVDEVGALAAAGRGAGEGSATGSDPTGGAEPTGGADPVALALALSEPDAPRGAGTVVLSRGAAGAVLVSGGRAWTAVAPDVVADNTVGCGDTMTAALALATAARLAPPRALELAVAVASAAAMTPETGRFRPADAEALLDVVRAVPLLIGR